MNLDFTSNGIADFKFRQFRPEASAIGTGKNGGRRVSSGKEE
jgi:hypothetical protein